MSAGAVEVPYDSLQPAHQSPLSVRVPVGDQRLQEIVDARRRLLAMYDARRRAWLHRAGPLLAAASVPHGGAGHRRASASARVPAGAGAEP